MINFFKNVFKGIIFLLGMCVVVGIVVGGGYLLFKLFVYGMNSLIYGNG